MRKPKSYTRTTDTYLFVGLLHNGGDRRLDLRGEVLEDFGFRCLRMTDNEHKRRHNNLYVKQTWAPTALNRMQTQ